MNNSIFEVEDGFVVYLGHNAFLNKNCDRVKGKTNAHIFRDEKQAEDALRSWILNQEK